MAILAGGTGLYLRAVARGLDTDALPSDPALRARIETGLDEDGLEPTVARLREVAPTLAATIGLPVDAGKIDGECLSGIVGVTCPSR